MADPSQPTRISLGGHHPARSIGLGLVSAIALSSSLLAGQQTLRPADRNVVYGIVSGASLLMDVYRPATSNGLGVVLIAGSAWGMAGPYQRGYEAVPLKIDMETDYLGAFGRGLVDRGYTVFVVEHRFAPAFRYQAIIDDARRAVRYIRAHAVDYGIDAAHLGAAGESSGGYLAAMLGLTDVTLENPTKALVEAQSSRVQAVVTLAGPFVMTELPGLAKILTGVIGGPPEQGADGQPLLTGAYADASPITYVTPDDSPMLMYQADDDPVVAKQGAAMMLAKLQAARVPATLVTRQTGGHAPRFDLDEVDRWFRLYLKSK